MRHRARTSRPCSGCISRALQLESVPLGGVAGFATGVIGDVCVCAVFEQQLVGVYTALIGSPDQGGSNNKVYNGSQLMAQMKAAAYSRNELHGAQVQACCLLHELGLASC